MKKLLLPLFAVLVFPFALSAQTLEEEHAALQPETLQVRRHARLGSRPRHQQHAPLVGRRLDADPAQRIEIGLDHVAQGVARRHLEMGETLLPMLVASGHCRPDRPARLE